MSAPPSHSAPQRTSTRFSMPPSFPNRRRVTGDVQVLAALAEGGRLLAQTGGHRVFGGDAVRLRVVAHVLGDLHRTEVRAAHRAEMRALRRRRRQRLVVEL